MTTIGDTISRVRNTIKGVKEDAFITDRYIYSLVLKYAKLYIQRQDTVNQILKYQNLFEVIPCVELIEVDKIEACCGGIKSKCTVMRTKEKLPIVLQGSYGPLFRTVSSLDYSVLAYSTSPAIYTAMANSTTFKYNKNAYYWYLDGYMYFPNVLWEAARIEGIWADSINYLKCNSDTVCKIRQDDNTNIPEYMFAEIEKMVLSDIMALAQIPQEPAENGQNILRS
jgi:hypothetical protein|tara:strand:+ start:688 stop:1362 length:675 start_codon:yes stop_codon:yes gene_type:complete